MLVICMRCIVSYRFVLEHKICKRPSCRPSLTLKLLQSDMTGAQPDSPYSLNTILLWLNWQRACKRLQQPVICLQAKRTGKVCGHECPTAQHHWPDGSSDGALCGASKGDCCMKIEAGMYSSTASQLLLPDRQASMQLHKHVCTGCRSADSSRYTSPVNLQQRLTHMCMVLL